MERDPAPGEIYAVNDPFTGGTHLPDITLVSRTEVGFAVSRAHHADVGGMEPSSLPAESRELYQEGVVIPPVRLDDEVLRLVVANMRNPDERRGDLRAQIAAQRLAERRIAELCEAHGRATRRGGDGRAVRVLRAARAGGPPRRCRTVATRRPTCSSRSRATLEIRAAVTIAGDEIEIDFAGTSPQHDGNLNCPLAVTRSACFYVVRCLTAPDIPASGGAYVPVTVLAPAGLTGERRARRPRWSPGTPRRRAGSRTSLFRALRPGRRRAGAGPGDDEQRHPRKPALHVLRDDRRGAGRLPRQRRPVGGPRRDVERAQHTGRGARARLSASEFAATSFGPGRAGPGAFEEATASSASSRRWSACRRIAPDRARAVRRPPALAGGRRASLAGTS